MVIAAAPTIATPQQALDARRTDTRGVLYIGGVLTPYVQARADFHLGDTAVGRITLPLPRPAHVTTNAPIEWQSGHNDLVGTTFAGYLPRYDFAMTAQGDTLELLAAGSKRLLTETFRDDIVYPGPVDAGAVFVDLCERAHVPAYIAEAALTPAGTPLLLGGNPQIDDGAFVIRANSSPINQLEREINPFGMYVTDWPNGAVVLHRVLGTPSEAPAVTFAEGVHLGDTRRTYDAGEIVNVWDIRGATYEDVYGGEVPIRSIADPGSVPKHPEIPPWLNGYRYRQVSNSSLVRGDLADAYREAMEIEHAAATAPVRWEAVGVPGIAPGDAIEIDCDTVEVSNGRYWLVGLSLSDDDGGLMGDYEARAGAGEARPGIVDRTIVPIQSGVTHLGDETLSHYAVSAPSGTSKTWNITIPAKATAFNIRCWHHGTNSQIVDGVESEIQVTRWQAWLPGVDYTNKDNQPEASGTMPSVPEELGIRRNYKTFTVASDGTVTNSGYWSQAAIALGRLDAGDYVLRLVSGEKNGWDDFEVRLISAEVFGLQAAAGGGS